MILWFWGSGRGVWVGIRQIFRGFCGFSGFFLGGCIGFVILVICSGFLAVKCGILLFWLFGFDVFW